MTDNDYEESFAAGAVTLEYPPDGDGKFMLTARHTKSGDVLASGAFSKKIFESHSYQGQFLNPLTESLADRNGVDADETRQELREWFGEMNAQLQDENEAVYELLPADTREIIDGTESVKVRGGEPSTWHVELTLNGQTRELEFTAGEMVHGGAGALEEQIANQFFEVIEIGDEDWRAIRDAWQDRKEVVAVVNETVKDSIADRFLEFLANDIMPVAERDNMGNDVVAAWVDPTNEGAHADAPPDAPVVWVQSSAVVDKLETAGKSANHLPELVKTLIARGELYGSSARRRWAWDRRIRVYPFTPDALGVDPEEFRDSDPEPNHGGVEV